MFKILVVFLSFSALAGRPVMHSITRTDLINQSNFIFVGWPSPVKPSNKCSSTIGNFQVHKVFKGDKSYENKIISIAPNNYKLLESFQKAGKGASYAQTIYGDGSFNMEQSSSIIFANTNADGCIELTANGAQEHRFKENEIDAITSNDCQKVTYVIDQYLSGLPTNCEVDTDCVVKNYHADTCKDKKVYNREAEKKLDDNFNALKTAFFSSCQNYLNSRGACAPEKSPPFYCKNKVCSFGIAPEKFSKLVNFKSAKMHASCAPHDAGSHMIILKNANADFPYFSINWWGKFQPTNTPGTYELKNAGKNDFNHNFCRAENVCENLKNIELKIIINKSNKSILEYKVETNDGLHFQGNLDLVIDNNFREMCG